MEAYEDILSLFELGQGAGMAGYIREKWGQAVMLAFVAAGGPRAFAWCEPRDEPFRRKAFVEAFQEALENNPHLALPAAPPRHELGQ
jgi:hypothetical protein